MENAGGYYITKYGREMIAGFIAGDNWKLSRAMVGSGKPPEGSDPRTFTDLVAPIAKADMTNPLREDDTVSFTVQYRNDMNGGLGKAININEFGVFALGSDKKEYLIYYASLGDFPEPVTAYTKGRIDSREYPVRLVIADDVNVTLAYESGAYLTYSQMVRYVEVNMMPLFMAEFKRLLVEHNESKDAHPYHLGLLSGIEGRVKRLEDMFASNVKDNAFGFSFGSEADRAKLTFTGVLNMTLGQLEW